MLRMPYYGAKELQLGLDATTVWNIVALRARPLPPIYNSGVRYAREPMCHTEGVDRVCEEFLTAHEVFARRTGDCDDLAPWFASECRLRGEPARAFPRRSAVGWHIVVQRADGSIEDPSARLGMPTA